MNRKRCEVRTRRGAQCKRRATHTYHDWETCWQHHKPRPNKPLTKLTVSMFMPEEYVFDLLYPVVKPGAEVKYRYDPVGWFR